MKGNQSRKGSLTEAIVNVVIGYSVAVTSQVYVFPLVGINVPLETNMLIGLVFTVISIVRSFVLRRLFNKFNIFS